MQFLLFLLLLVLVAIIIFFVWQIYNVFFRGFAPIMRTGPKVIIRVLEILNPLGDYAGKKIYELGCGQAHFLQEFEKMFSKAELIGVENDLLTCIIAGIQLAFRKSKIKIVWKNLYKVNLSEADLIYCYLNDEMMAELEKKFRFECKIKTQIVSHQYPLPNIESYKIIDLNDVKVKRGNEAKVYFYEIYK